MAYRQNHCAEFDLMGCPYSEGLTEQLDSNKLNARIEYKSEAVDAKHIRKIQLSNGLKFGIISFGVTVFTLKIGPS